MGILKKTSLEVDGILHKKSELITRNCYGEISLWKEIGFLVEKFVSACVTFIFLSTISTKFRPIVKDIGKIISQSKLVLLKSKKNNIT